MGRIIFCIDGLVMSILLDSPDPRDAGDVRMRRELAKVEFAAFKEK